jgi:hypothetical protein
MTAPIVFTVAGVLLAHGPLAPLGIGLPLLIALGTLAAFILPGVSDIWLALLVGAALAPTDAALGAAVMVNRAVPARIRRPRWAVAAAGWSRWPVAAAEWPRGSPARRLGMPDRLPSWSDGQC